MGREWRFIPATTPNSLFSWPPHFVVFSDPTSITSDPEYGRKLMGVWWSPTNSGRDVSYCRCDSSDGPGEFMNVDRRAFIQTSGGYRVRDLPKVQGDHISDFPTACYSAAALAVGGVASLQTCRQSWFTQAFSSQ